MKINFRGQFITADSLSPTSYDNRFMQWRGEQHVKSYIFTQRLVTVYKDATVSEIRSVPIR